MCTYLSQVLSFGLRALHHVQLNSVSTAELITCLLIAVCHTYVITMIHVCYRCRLLAVGLCTMYSHILNRDSIIFCHISYTCHKCPLCLSQVSSFGSGGLHPMWLRSSCKAACTAKPFRCHPATAFSKTSLRLLLSMLPRSLLADHQLLDASQVTDLTCSSCSSIMHSPMQHVLHDAYDDIIVCEMTIYAQGVWCKVALHGIANLLCLHKCSALYVAMQWFAC